MVTSRGAVVGSQGIWQTYVLGADGGEQGQELLAKAAALTVPVETMQVIAAIIEDGSGG